MPNRSAILSSRFVASVETETVSGVFFMGGIAWDSIVPRIFLMLPPKSTLFHVMVRGRSKYLLCRSLCNKAKERALYLCPSLGVEPRNSAIIGGFSDF